MLWALLLSLGLCLRGRLLFHAAKAPERGLGHLYGIEGTVEIIRCLTDYIVNILAGNPAQFLALCLGRAEHLGAFCLGSPDYLLFPYPTPCGGD